MCQKTNVEYNIKTLLSQCPHQIIIQELYFSKSFNNASLFAPEILSTFSPFFKTMKVGTHWMLNLAAISSSSSTSTFTTTTFECDLAISSSAGAIILHGPHQFAWKSTKTALSPASFNTCSKSSSDSMMILALAIPEQGV